VTSRGMLGPQMRIIGQIIVDCLQKRSNNTILKQKVLELANNFIA